jgi:hypothetical protein
MSKKLPYSKSIPKDWGFVWLGGWEFRKNRDGERQTHTTVFPTATENPLDYDWLFTAGRDLLVKCASDIPDLRKLIAYSALKAGARSVEFQLPIPANFRERDYWDSAKLEPFFERYER